MGLDPGCSSYLIDFILASGNARNRAGFRIFVNVNLT